MATRYQDGGDSNASQERGRPSGQQPGDPQVGDPFLSPLESSYRDLLDPPPSPGLAWSRSSHPLLMAGQTGAAASSLYRPVTPLPSLVRIGGPWQLCLGRAQCSPLSLLTAILSSLAPSHWWPPQPPCAQSQLPAAYFDPRLSPELYSVPSPCQSLSHPPALASNEQWPETDPEWSRCWQTSDQRQQSSSSVTRRMCRWLRTFPEVRWRTTSIHFVSCWSDFQKVLKHRKVMLLPLSQAWPWGWNLWLGRNKQILPCHQPSQSNTVGFQILKGKTGFIQWPENCWL